MLSRKSCEESNSATCPNPSNQSTPAACEVPNPERVQIAVYDLTGRRTEILVDLQLVPGRHEARFEAGDLSSGIYIYRMSGVSRFEDVASRQ